MVDLKKVCKTLESKRCKIHRKNPTATVKGNSIKLTCCCNSFEKELERQIDVEISKQIDKNVNDIFKGF